MELQLARIDKTNQRCIGQLEDVSEVGDPKFLCWTLEDTERERAGVPVEVWKIPGATAIPRGRYKITITFSNRFQRMLPLLNNVPGFSGIRIHPGNTSEDTEGCILPGMNRDTDSVTQSRTAFTFLFNRLRFVLDKKSEEVWITII